MNKKTPAVIKQLYATAIAGDVQAMRTWLERVLPALKPVSSVVLMPEVATAATATEQALLIVKAMANGELAPDVMHEILAGIGQASRIAEIDELARRIAALEQRGAE